MGDGRTISNNRSADEGLHLASNPWLEEEKDCSKRKRVPESQIAWIISEERSWNSWLIG